MPTLNGAARKAATVMPSSEELDQHEKMQRAFNLVAQKDDWKAPINVVLPVTALQDLTLGDILDAIEYMTATTPSIHKTTMRIDGVDQAAVLVMAKGYRMGPAGDH